MGVCCTSSFIEPHQTWVFTILYMYIYIWRIQPHWFVFFRGIYLVSCTFITLSGLLNFGEPFGSPISDPPRYWLGSLLDSGLAQHGPGTGCEKTPRNVEFAHQMGDSGLCKQWLASYGWLVSWECFVLQSLNPTKNPSKKSLQAEVDTAASRLTDVTPEAAKLSNGLYKVVPHSLLSSLSPIWGFPELGVPQNE